MLVVHPAAAVVLVAHLTGTATRVSPFSDNLRHLYEDGGRTRRELAEWFDISERHMYYLLKRAGTKFRKPAIRSVRVKPMPQRRIMK